MKSILYFLLLYCVIAQSTYAQIGMGGQPHPSAALDVKSPANDKAFYPPRLTTAQRKAIINPQAGAFVYDLDKGTLFMFDGQNWSPLAFTSVNNLAPIDRTASDGTANDNFGWSVAISGDYAIVGASQDNIGANSYQGSAYVFVRSGNSWTFQAKLTAIDGAANDFFGSSVAISGDYAIVGAVLDDIGADSNQGSAYVFRRTGSTWTLQNKLTAGDGGADDLFGGSVAISGDYAIVGAFNDDIGANTDQGSAYVFVRTFSGWFFQAKLTASDGAADDNFGYSVAISGDYAIVGANGDDIGANSYQGSAYVFVRSGTNWTQQAKLTASDGAAGDYFGHSVAISGDYAIVGAIDDDNGAYSNQGSAYVFQRTGISWTEQAKLTPGDRAADDNFGNSVAISGDYALVGAAFDDIGANSDQGSAYVFVPSGRNWTQQAKLTASDGAANDNFGFSVAISGDYAIVGAWGDDIGANSGQGSAYLFVRSGSSWTQQAKLTASDGAVGDNFGRSVAISGDYALVGANGDAIGANSGQGSAYVFVRPGNSWTEQAKLTPGDRAANDFFGVSVAISGDYALVGAVYDDIGANSDQGSAYVFKLTGTSWSQIRQVVDNSPADTQNGWGVGISNGSFIIGGIGFESFKGKVSFGTVDN